MRNVHSLVIIGFFLFGIVFTINDAFGAGFVKFDGVDGETTDKDHKGWSDLISFSKNTVSSSDSASVRSSHDFAEEIIIVKNLDSAGPKLAVSVAEGKTFPFVWVNLCSNEMSCYLTYELTNVMITSYSIGGSAGDIPTEEISLSFEKIIETKGPEPSREVEKETADPKEKEPVRVDEPEQEEKMIKEKPRVPEWVQTTSKFWVDKNVSDREFTDALGYLVKEKIIDVEAESQVSEHTETQEEPKVPAWIAQTTDWWINGQVPEEQFLEGIKWMIINGIIRGI